MREEVVSSNVCTKIRQDRRYFIGGSDARVIMGNDEPALIRLWREKRGEVESEDLSGNLVVQLGVATENLNRRWYEVNTGQIIIDIQKKVRHPALRWMGATLDGRIAGSDAASDLLYDDLLRSTERLMLYTAPTRDSVLRHCTVRLLLCGRCEHRPRAAGLLPSRQASTPDQIGFVLHCARRQGAVN
jgi:hypothetical protein